MQDVIEQETKQIKTMEKESILDPLTGTRQKTDIGKISIRSPLFGTGLSLDQQMGSIQKRKIKPVSIVDRVMSMDTQLMQIQMPLQRQDIKTRQDQIMGQQQSYAQMQMQSQLNRQMQQMEQNMEQKTSTGMKKTSGQHLNWQGTMAASVKKCAGMKTRKKKGASFPMEE